MAHTGSVRDDALSQVGQAAVGYTRRGWHLIQLKPSGKTPVGAWKGRATRDAGFVEGLWREKPDSNVGIVAGPSGLVVIDLDGEEAIEHVRALLDADSWPTPFVATTARGVHLYFSADPDRPLGPAAAVGGIDGLDVRAGDSYVVAPPSVHETGHRYAWADPPPPDAPPPPLPEALRGLIAGERTSATLRGAVAAGDPVIPEGRRNASLASLAGLMRRGGMTDDELNAALQALNASRCTPPLPVEEVSGIARSVGRYAPPRRGDVDVIANPARYAPSADQLPNPPIRWLWRGRMLADGVTILAGDSGAGKSTVYTDMAARLSRGDALPHDPGSAGDPSRVLIIGHEDRTSALDVKRLKAAGARMANVNVWSPGRDVPSLRVPQHVAVIGELVETLRPRLVVLDPLMSFMGCGLSANRGDDVRAKPSTRSRTWRKTSASPYSSSITPARGRRTGWRGRTWWPGQGSSKPPSGT